MLWEFLKKKKKKKIMGFKLISHGQPYHKHLTYCEPQSRLKTFIV